MSLVVFVVVALVAVGSALGLVLRRNPIHGALFLVVNLGAIAVFYLMLGAEFLAAAQVIVYAGAIMVLFIFAIMVLIPGRAEVGPDPLGPQRLLALPFAAVCCACGRCRPRPCCSCCSAPGSSCPGRPRRAGPGPRPVTWRRSGACSSPTTCSRSN